MNCITASTIAAALRTVSRQAISKRLAHLPSKVITVRGIPTKAWEFCVLPAELQNELEKRADQRGYRNALAMLSVPLEQITDRQAPRRTRPVSQPQTMGDFEKLDAHIGEIDFSRPDPDQVDMLWRYAFELFDQLTIQRFTERQAGENIRHYLWTKAPFLAASRDALLKQFNYWLPRWKADRATAFRDLRKENKGTLSDLSSRIEGLGWFVPAARFFYLLTNRTHNSGSIREALRRTISLPVLPIGWTGKTKNQFLRAIALDKPPTCPTDIRNQILARQRAGKPMVPERIARAIPASAATIAQQRHPTNAALNYLSAPGSMFFIHDSKTGERRPPIVGEVIEADDATINFPVCVPWTLGGDPCSDKYGVKVGRFQWLVSIDAVRGYVTAYSYTMRPRSSYRGEDALALIRAHCLQHGKPKLARFEQGVWKSHLVKNALAAVGIELQTVWSPHQKPRIEGLFNSLWTKLSVQFPDAHVGRFRGENEAANDLLVACQRGNQDPRRHFPMLSTTIAAFDEVIREKNNTPVKSKIGSWVPAEAWEQRERGGELDANADWLFSPWQREWKVRGMNVGGKLPIFEDFSVPFDFSADWLPQYHGALVRCHFDPTAPRCHAMVVLAEPFRNEPAGKVLGLAQLNNDVAAHARLVMGWGDDPADAGRIARQRAAAALRREVRAVVPAGRGYAASEERDGVVGAALVERDSPKVAPLNPDAEKSRSRLAANFDHEQFERMIQEAELERTERALELEEFERKNALLFL